MEESLTIGGALEISSAKWWPAQMITPSSRRGFGTKPVTRGPQGTAARVGDSG